jgi:hypothetical protein
MWSPPRLRRSTTAKDARAAQTVTAEYVYTRTELQPVLTALREALGCGAVPLDSPHRLQDALGTLIRGMGGRGEVSVRRSPAALLTPEYWQIVFTDLDGRTHAEIREKLMVGRP